MFNAGLLSKSHFESGISCDWPTRSRIFMVFLLARKNADEVPKFHGILRGIPQNVRTKSHTSVSFPTFILQLIVNINGKAPLELSPMLITKLKQ